MKLITRHAAAILVLLFALTATAPAQQKRQAPPKTPPKPAAAPAPAPAPTFETLLPADSYAIYVEVRGAGQLVRSSTINDLLEPILKLAGPPKEFKTIVKWLNAHSEQLLNSRLLIAAWPMNKTVPETIVAVEFASAEEATKFVTPLNEFLPTILQSPTPEPSPKTKNESDKSSAAPKADPPAPTFNLQRLGSLVLIAPRPWTMKQLKPAGSKLLAEDVNFRTVRNRFNSEPVFAFIDIKALEREEEERNKQAEESRRQVQEQVERGQTVTVQEQKKTDKTQPEEMTPEQEAAEAETIAKLQPVPTADTPKEAPTPDPISTALSSIGSSFFGGPSDWPDAIGLALSFEGESFDLRALFVNAPGEKADVVPFMPNLIAGPVIAPETPNIFPADTELLVTMSLDLPQIYAAMSKPRPPNEYTTSRGQMVTVHREEFVSPFADIEKRLKINLRDDLLPLLGPEVAVRLPMTGMGIVGLAGVMVSTPDAKEDQPSSSAIAVAIAVRDKEALRALMPKLIEGMAFKGASSFAQTERREDTELVSYANMFSYAFVGNFIVLSADPKATRQIVDSYLKHETLASESQFKNFTRWQPRQLHGQIYISPSLMESYKTLATQPTLGLSDQTRAFFSRLSMVSQPITYALSNEGFGPLHELHLPKNLVLMAVAGISGETNPPPMVQNERIAIGMMYSIVSAEQQHKASKGNYVTLEELMAADMVPKKMIENSGYKFELMVSGDKFEVTAVPSEYGKSGTLSLFIDQTFALRGSDRNGAPATASDPPIR